MLILIAPAGQEDVFYEFSEPAAARELPPSSMAMPDLEAVEARDREYGVTYLGPPISAEPVPAPQLPERPARRSAAAPRGGGDPSEAVTRGRRAAGLRRGCGSR